MYQDNRTWRHLYNGRWRKISKRYLLDNPLCAICLDVGKVTQACVVDHVVPHKGNVDLFYSQENFQSTCQHCHNSIKARQENSGIMPGVDVHGVPIDSSHPWNK